MRSTFEYRSPISLKLVISFIFLSTLRVSNLPNGIVHKEEEITIFGFNNSRWFRELQEKKNKKERRESPELQVRAIKAICLYNERCKNQKEKYTSHMLIEALKGQNTKTPFLFFFPLIR